MSLHSETSRSHHSSSTSISSSRSDYHFSQEADDDNHEEYENIRTGLFNSGGSRSFSSTSMSQRGRGGDPNEEGNNRGTRGEQGGPRYALERSRFKPIIKERCQQYVQVTPVRNYPIK